MTNSGVYYPAGLWEEHGQPIIIPGVWKQINPVYDDPNITHFVGISGSTIDIIANDDYYGRAGMHKYMFQAGPLVLSGNIVQDFGQSWHARESHERTLIGKTASGKVYFFLSRKELSLGEIGERIIRDPRFQTDPITVINLDG